MHLSKSLFVSFEPQTEHKLYDCRYVKIAGTRSKGHITLLSLSSYNWFLMFSLKCNERKGGNPSPLRETNASLSRVQWVSGRIIKKHLETQRRPQFVEHRGILRICMHSFMHFCASALIPPNANFIHKTSGKKLWKENVLRCPLLFALSVSYALPWWISSTFPAWARSWTHIIFRVAYTGTRDWEKRGRVLRSGQILNMAQNKTNKWYRALIIV